MSVKPTTKRLPTADRPRRGRADLTRLRRTTEAEIRRTSPPELANLPDDFWAEAELVLPQPKQAISFRVDQDVLEWFKEQGPRYQTRMNAVLRSYMRQASNQHRQRTRRSERSSR